LSKKKSSVKRSRYGDYDLKVVFPIFAHYTIHVVFTENLVKSRMDRYGDAGAAGSGQTQAMSSTATGGIGHLFFPPLARAGVIAHEAWHGIYRLFEWAGVELENETIAYHLGYLVNQITQFQKKILSDPNSFKFRR